MPMRWGFGVADMARAIAAGEPHSATAERAAHVVEIATAINRSAETGEPVELPAVDPAGLRSRP